MDKAMKVSKFIWLLLFSSLLARAQTNEVRTWSLTTGQTFTGSYYTSGAKTVVIKSNGTNALLPIECLSSNDWLYYYNRKIVAQKIQFDAEAARFRAGGFTEFTSDYINNFPEKNQYQNGWWDVTFERFDKFAGSEAWMDVGFDIRDTDENNFDGCAVKKENDGGDWMPNPLANQITVLKYGDKIRLIGWVKAKPGYETDAVPEMIFYVDRFEIIETAADMHRARQIKDDQENGVIYNTYTGLKSP